MAGTSFGDLISKLHSSATLTDNVSDDTILIVDNTTIRTHIYVSL